MPEKPHEALWSVGQVAARSGVSVATLHFYERKGLISSWRNPGNQRRYSKDVLRKVAIIKIAQKMGVSLAEIGRAFSCLPDDQTTQKDWQILAKQWQGELQTRIETLQRLNQLLTGCIGCGCLSMKQCPLHNQHDCAAQLGTGAVFIEQNQPK